MEYLSSAGWRVFLNEIKKIRDNGGDLKLACMQPDVCEIYDLLELSFILKTYDTAEEAVAKILTWLLLCLVRQKYGDNRNLHRQNLRRRMEEF